jgi:hypothetical protein
MPEGLIVEAIQEVVSRLRVKIYKQVQKELAAKAKLYREKIGPGLESLDPHKTALYHEVAVCLEEDSCGWGLKASQLEESMKPKEKT